MILHVGVVGLEYEPHYVLSEPEVIGLMRGAYQKAAPYLSAGSPGASRALTQR